MEPEPSVPIEGHVDDIRPDRVRGWVWFPDRPETPASLELVDSAGAIVARACADLFRADLEQAGKRAGRCGYEIAIPAGAHGPLALHVSSTAIERSHAPLADGIAAPGAA